MAENQGTPHALYRFFDATGALLYVGITLNPGARWTTHSKEKPWWAEVASVTVEQFPDRESVLAAERAAIINEGPTYNVVHNQGGKAATVILTPAEPDQAGTYTPEQNEWTYRGRRAGNIVTGPLYLYWEVEGDPISDLYSPREETAHDVLRSWIAARRDRGSDLARLGISWYLTPCWEAAPFQRHDWMAEDFLTWFSWPEHPRSGEPVSLNRLPVVDKLWQPGCADKGGFIQAATKWKPAPLQATMDLPQVLAAAGLHAMQRRPGGGWR